LFNRHQFEFPEVSDLGSFCMGEMEGHYQPVLKPDYKQESLGMLQNSLHHFAYDDEEKWLKRHEKYAIWEAGMIATKAYPREDNMWRDMLKSAFRHMPMRGWVAFFHSYLFKLGFFDGKAGLDFANSRKQYYQMVDQSLWRFKNQ
jgi:hypothetical protein